MTDTPAPFADRRKRHFRQWFWLTGIVCFFLFIYLIRSILLPFVVGMLAAYFLDPAVRHLRVRGCSRTVSSAVITISFFIIAVVLCSVLVPLTLRQLSSLASEMPGYLQALQVKYGDDVQHYLNMLSPAEIEPLKTAAHNVGGTIATMLSGVIPEMLKSGLAVLNMFSLIFLTPVVVFYLLRDWDRFVKRFDDMLPRDYADVIRTQLHEIDHTLSGFIRGQTNVCLLMATYYGICLSVIELNFGLGMGILTGFLLFIPFVGYASSAAVCITIGLFQFGWDGHMIALIAVFTAGVVMESGVITPKLVGGKVGLHPLWIIFGMLSGAALFGFVGVLISLPVTAVIGVLVRFAIAQYMSSSLYVSGR